MKLGLAAGMARDKPGSLEPLLDELQAELGDALNSLRNLVRGVYPPLLETKGLRAALRARARQVPIGVDVECDSERYSRELEGAICFCSSEALQNVTKHSRATRIGACVARGRAAKFRSSRQWPRTCTTRPRPGGGLQNLRDRLDVLGGAVGATTIVQGDVVLDANGNPVSFTPDASKPTFTRLLQQWFGVQSNNRNYSTSSTANFRGTSSSGGSASLHFNMHVNTTGSAPAVPNMNSLHFDVSCS